MKDKPKLTANFQRHAIRLELSRVRRASYAALQIYRKTGSVDALEKRKNYRRHERVLSRELALLPPFLNANREPYWPPGHFKRFRHSALFGRFKKVWSEIRQRNLWVRKHV